uniref:ornithine decarboxylase n=1 Tax=Saccoglossus kowalevskii TaxID=10224 RepID=A0ABM0M8D9_SACKO|nr:PREDICTED: probable ornithine decarboxylase-like [Saccoglossus kowalevskii]
MDIGEVVRRFKEWQSLLPRVHPFYAVKCNSHPVILTVLGALGSGFDCASKSEIEDVLNIGVPASRIIYANPCKSKTHLQFAADKKAGLMTFDDEYELHKIKEVYPDAELVIRIKADDPSALVNLGIKFGCDVKHTIHLLHVAKKLNLSVVGVSSNSLASISLTVKCNSHPVILTVLGALGSGFDCASKSEIEDVLNIGVPASRIIYANPCKSKTHLQFAADKKAGLMTFDDEYELHKIKEVYPDAESFLKPRLVGVGLLNKNM